MASSSNSNSNSSSSGGGGGGVVGMKSDEDVSIRRMEDEEERMSERVLPPSHILANGNFVYLPPPSELERNRELESDVARYQLLNGSQFGKSSSKSDENEKEEEEDQKEDSAKTWIHPLAVASARLQTHGISELSKAINLSGLVSSGDYFQLSNIVQKNLGTDDGNTTSEGSKGTAAVVAATSSATGTSSTGVDAAGVSSTAAITATAADVGSSSQSNVEMEEEEEGKIRSQYLLRRKRQQFSVAHKTLSRHVKRLRITMANDSISLRGLLRLRKSWRLVAPERKDHHHPLQPHDILAIDVQLYNHNPTTPTNNNNNNNNNMLTRPTKNLSRWIPRFATIQLDHEAWYDQHKDKTTHDLANDLWNHYTQHDYHNNNNQQLTFPTKATPFSITNHLHNTTHHTNIPMYTLQLSILKSSPTHHYRQTVTLDPPSDDYTGMIIPALQHSLFCANLFETIQQEIPHSTAWLSSSQTNTESFYPAPSYMANPSKKLAVIYAHQGEIQVQLDAEYSLILQLVEHTNHNTHNHNHTNNNHNHTHSGSQSPEQLHVLCRILLYHAQCSYHSHCRRLEQLLLQKKRQQQMNQASSTKYHALKSTDTTLESPNILSNCVEMGNKFILERKIRKTLTKVQNWIATKLTSQYPNIPNLTLQVQWVPLPLISSKSQFAICFMDTLCMDVLIHGQTITVTQLSSSYRVTHFTGCEEFQMLLQMQLLIILKQQSSSSINHTETQS